MDVALEILDPLVLDKAWAYFLPQTTPILGNSSIPAYDASAPVESAWPRDNIYRQLISLYVITAVGAASLYFVFSAFSYYCIFDRRLEYHPRFLKNQVRQEIASSMTAIPFIDILTLPFFIAEVRGHSLLYADVGQYGWWWMGVSTVLYMVWNDFLIYWIHRLEHHPSVYKYIHKPHHKWIGKSCAGKPGRRTWN